MAASSFYVYIHRRASDNSIFYIGKGSRRRAWSCADRSKFWKATADKHGLVVEIVFDRLDEPAAFRLEIDMIAGFRDLGARLANLTAGGDGVRACERQKQAAIKENARRRELGLGIYSAESREKQIKAASIVGKSASVRLVELATFESRSAAGKKGGKIAGRKIADEGLGIFSDKVLGKGGRVQRDRKSGLFSPEGRAASAAAGRLPHWHNPETGERRRAEECPGPGFIRGRGPLPRGLSDV